MEEDPPHIVVYMYYFVLITVLLVDLVVTPAGFPVSVGVSMVYSSMVVPTRCTVMMPVIVVTVIVVTVIMPARTLMMPMIIVPVVVPTRRTVRMPVMPMIVVIVMPVVVPTRLIFAVGGHMMLVRYGRVVMMTPTRCPFSMGVPAVVTMASMGLMKEDHSNDIDCTPNGAYHKQPLAIDVRGIQ